MSARCRGVRYEFRPVQALALRAPIDKIEIRLCDAKVHQVVFGRFFHGLGQFSFSAVCGLRFAVCGLRSAVCGLRFAVCGLRFAVCGLRFAVCGLRFAVCHKLCKDNVVTLMRMVKTKRYRHPAADDTIVFVRIIRNLLKTRIRSDTYSI